MFSHVDLVTLIHFEGASSERWSHGRRVDIRAGEEQLKLFGSRQALLPTTNNTCSVAIELSNKDSTRRSNKTISASVVVQKSGRRPKELSPRLARGTRERYRGQHFRVDKRPVDNPRTTTYRRSDMKTCTRMSSSSSVRCRGNMFRF